MTVEDRLELARNLLANWSSNDWMGGDDAETIAAARWAVRIEREDDSWISAANTVREIAALSYATRCDTEGYDEWISDVWSMETGETVACHEAFSVTVTIPGEEPATYSNEPTEGSTT